MGEIQSTQTKIFTEKIVEIWNQKVPGSKIGHSDAASIENGFKKEFSVILQQLSVRV